LRQQGINISNGPSFWQHALISSHSSASLSRHTFQMKHSLYSGVTVTILYTGPITRGGDLHDVQSLRDDWTPLLFQEPVKVSQGNLWGKVTAVELDTQVTRVSQNPLIRPLSFKICSLQWFAAFLGSKNC